MVKEIKIEFVYIECPVCKVRIYGFNELHVKRLLEEHLEQYHHKPSITLY